MSHLWYTVPSVRHISPPMDMQKFFCYTSRSSWKDLTFSNRRGYGRSCIAFRRVGMTLLRTGISMTDTCMTLSRGVARRYDTRSLQFAPKKCDRRTLITMRRNIISVSLSDELDDMLVDHWTQSGYASASEYIRELIRNDLRQNGKMPEPNGVPRVRSRDDRFRKPGR